LRGRFKEREREEERAVGGVDADRARVRVVRHDVRLPVHQIISMIKCVRTSKLSIQNSLSERASVRVVWHDVRAALLLFSYISILGGI